MLDLHQFKLELDKAEEEVEALEEVLHLVYLRHRLEELEQTAQLPDFWNDQERAQRVQQELSDGQKQLESFQQLKDGHEDLVLMVELYREAGEMSHDDEKELLAHWKAWQEKYQALRMETLFTGEHDRNNAILTIHAGAGGTEAQDWAQMLYRMFMRWAELS